MLGHIKHNTCVERALADGMGKLRREAYMASLVAAAPNGSKPTTTTSSSSGSGSSGGGSSSSSSNNNLVAAAASGNGPRSLPPLAPGSASSSRSGTPRRRHLEEAVFPPPDVFTSSLRRADSARFDDDHDMLEAGTPRAAAAAGLLGPQGPRQGQGDGQREAKRLRDLEAENEALKGQVEKLAQALSELLGKTERGLYHHQESVLTDGDLGSLLQSQSRSPSLLSRSPTPALGLSALKGGSSSISTLSEGGEGGRTQNGSPRGIPS
jgi:hypothetical protein